MLLLIFYFLFSTTLAKTVFQGSCGDVSVLCEQLCLTLSPETYECGCWNDHYLLEDSIACRLNTTSLLELEKLEHRMNELDIPVEVTTAGHKQSRALSFHGSNYAEFPVVDSAYLETTITIEFKLSEQRDGILFFGGQFKGDDFLSIAAIGPNIIIRHDCGEGTIEDMYRGPFAISLWHNLTVWRKYCDRIEMRADQKTRMVDVNEQFKSYKGISMEEGIFIGGAPRNIEYLEAKAGTERGFTGCVRKVVVNEKVLLDTSDVVNKAVNTHSLQFCGAPPTEKQHISDEFFEFDIATGDELINEDRLMEQMKKHEKTTRALATTTTTVATTTKEQTTTTTALPVPERLRVAEFTGAGLLESLAPVDIQDYMELEMHIKPAKQNGIIFYWKSEEKHIALYLDRGFVLVHTSFGHDSILLRSEHLLALHQWNKIELWRSGKGLLLKVNRQSWIEAELRSLGSTSTFIGSVFIGGFTGQMPKILQPQPNFKGCIKHIRLNGHSIALLSSPSIHECSIDPCASAGCPKTCSANQDDFVCLCDWPTYGRKCDKVAPSNLSAMKFSRHSYMEFTGEKYMNKITGDSLRLTIEFKLENITNPEYAKNKQVLASAGEMQTDSDYLRLVINGDRQVEFSINLGSGAVQLIHPMSLETGKWYSIAVIREKRHVTISVNGESPISTLAPEGSEQLNVYSSFYIGGIPSESMSSDGLSGCIESVDVGGMIITHPTQAHNSYNIKDCKI